jgi:hypothetical protein
MFFAHFINHLSSKLFINTSSNDTFIRYTDNPSSSQSVSVSGEGLTHEWFTMQCFVLHECVCQICHACTVLVVCTFMSNAMSLGLDVYKRCRSIKLITERSHKPCTLLPNVHVHCLSCRSCGDWCSWCCSLWSFWS